MPNADLKRDLLQKEALRDAYKTKAQAVFAPGRGNRGPLPSPPWVVGFWYAFDLHRLPAAAKLMHDIIDEALMQPRTSKLQRRIKSATSRSILNRRIAHQPNRSWWLAAFAHWLCMPETHAAARKAGLYNALQLWRRAVARLRSGAMAHVAFGMNQPGARYGYDFTVYQDAAIVALYFQHVCRRPAGAALRDAISLWSGTVGGLAQKPVQEAMKQARRALNLPLRPPEHPASDRRAARHYYKAVAQLERHAVAVYTRYLFGPRPGCLPRAVIH